MSTSPVSPEDIRAAAAAHQELGPEYSDAVVAAFLDKVDREVAARVEARLADTPQAKPVKRGNRRTLLTGMAIGACAGAMAVAAVTGLPAGPAHGTRHVTPVAHKRIPAPNGPPRVAIVPPNSG